ncbi:ABC transporter transmembrane domain-containing protein [Rothia sp. P4278]|uniref:ABC transporter transmembrane domain-containing protein n=1 Tax=Rothia sp. P4278 TaxID=3402658 RepID=UPI003AE2DE2A
MAKDRTEQSEHKNTQNTEKFRIAPPGFRWRTLYFLPFVLDFFASLATVFMPVLVGRIIDLHSSGLSTQAYQAIMILAGVIAYLCLVEFLGWGLTFRVVARIERDWRLYISHLIDRAPHRDPGALIAILNKDARALSQMWQPMILAFSAVGVTSLGTWQLWTISPLIALVALTGLIVTMITLTWVSKLIEKHSDAFRETVSVSTSRASDIASSIRTILGLGAQKRMMVHYGQAAQDVYSSQIRLESVQTWSYATRNLLVGTVTWLAVVLALRGAAPEGTWLTDIPAGQLVTIVGLIGTLTGPIWSVEMLLMSWRNARVAYKRVVRLKREIADASSAASPPAPQGAHTARVLVPSGTGAVHYINPRCAGISAQEYAETLVQKLRDDSQGDNHRILLSEPTPIIFAGTLSEHLTLGRGTLTRDEMVDLLKITDSEEIAIRLGGRDPESYVKSALSSEGTNLSGGQRQRLALARALAQRADTLVLTEPLNSVDEPSQKFILNQLEERAGQPGVLAHIERIYIVSTTMEVERRLKAGELDG